MALYPLIIAARYLRAKKAAFVSVGTFFAILGVALGVCALATVMSVTGGFQAEFREKVLGVNAHVLVLKYAADFREYREVMATIEGAPASAGSAAVPGVPGVLGISPFTINPMMVSNGKITATGVLLKGVDPTLMPAVLDLPKHITAPTDPDPKRSSELKAIAIAALRRPGAEPAKRPGSQSPFPPSTWLTPEPTSLGLSPTTAPVASALPSGAKPLLPSIAPTSTGSPPSNDALPNVLPAPASTGTSPPSAGTTLNLGGTVAPAPPVPPSLDPPSSGATDAAPKAEGAREPSPGPREPLPGPREPSLVGPREPSLADPADGSKKISLMDAIDRSIAAGRAKQGQGAWKGDLPEIPGTATSSSSKPSPAKPTGSSITPEGGFKSKLPKDDDFLDNLIPDPCKGPERDKLPGIIIGSSLARNLSLKLGDCMQVTSPTIGYSYSGNSIRPPVAKQFRVTATFEAGFDQYDSKLVYTDLYEAQAFYDAGDSVTGVEMRVNDIENAKNISRLIDAKLGNGIYHTMDWEELNHGLFTALKIQQIGMSAVLALIIVVAAFTVVATLIMVVLDKKKEIAVLKAMGATDEAVLQIFLYQGAFIGLMGTGLGLLLGVVVCKVVLRFGFPLDPKVYFISQLPVDVRPMEFLTTGVIAIIICILATIPPALYASRLQPAEAVRDMG